MNVHAVYAPTVTNRYDELDEVVCELAPPLTKCSLGNGLISQVGYSDNCIYA